MKTSEMIAMLEENPRLRFRATNDRTRMKFYCILGYYFCDVYNSSDGELISPSSDGGGFNGNFSMDLEWEIIPIPVTWQDDTVRTHRA